MYQKVSISWLWVWKLSWSSDVDYTDRRILLGCVQKSLLVQVRRPCGKVCSMALSEVIVRTAHNQLLLVPLSCCRGAPCNFQVWVSGCSRRSITHLGRRRELPLRTCSCGGKCLQLVRMKQCGGIESLGCWPPLFLKAVSGGTGGKISADHRRSDGSWSYCGTANAAVQPVLLQCMAQRPVFWGVMAGWCRVCGIPGTGDMSRCWAVDAELFQPLSWQGALIKDGGVHFIAGLRLVTRIWSRECPALANKWACRCKPHSATVVLQITGCEVVSVSAITRHVDTELPPPDNVSALMYGRLTVMQRSPTFIFLQHETFGHPWLGLVILHGRQLENGCAGVLVMSWSSTSRKVRNSTETAGMFYNSHGLSHARTTSTGELASGGIQGHCRSREGVPSWPSWICGKANESGYLLVNELLFFWRVRRSQATLYPRDGESSSYFQKFCGVQEELKAFIGDVENAVFRVMQVFWLWEPK